MRNGVDVVMFIVYRTDRYTCNYFFLPKRGNFRFFNGLPLDINLTINQEYLFSTIIWDIGHVKKY